MNRRERLENDATHLADVLDDLTDAFNSGRQLDVQHYLDRFPEHATRIRQLVGALEAMAQLGAGSGSLGPTDQLRQPASIQQTLGDFRLLEEIGRGGMGVVYRAEQLSLGRHVAVKVFPYAHLMEQRHLERFKNEARAASMLRHAHIVNVFQVGCERGVYFYAMDLIEGESLADVIDQFKSSCPGTSRDVLQDPPSNGETEPIAAMTTQFSTCPREHCRTVARLGLQAAGALQFAHELGIIHRDIKPSNLLLDRDGQLHLTDFGLAQIAVCDSLTLTGDLVGTLRYMSPEQAAGNRLIDCRTDVYSLGLTLYELATGRPAYTTADRQQLIYELRETRPPQPAKMNPQIPRDLETIILKAIEKDPASRYDSAQEMADDLSRFLEQKPIRARRASRWERTLS